MVCSSFMYKDDWYHIITIKFINNIGKTIYKLTIAISLFLILSRFSVAEDFDINFPHQLNSASGQKLLLNGTGFRKVTILGIKVYKAGLYIPSKSSSVEAILSINGDKILKIIFLRDVDKEDIQDAWLELFESNNEDYLKYEEQTKVISESLPEFKKDDDLQINCISNTVTMTVNSNIITKFDRAGLCSAVLKMWIGKEPANESLKAGLLNSD